MRLAAPLAIVALAAALLAGCGGSSSNGGSTSGGGSTRTESKASAPANNSTAPVGAAAKSCDTHAVDARALRATGIPCGQARQVMYGWQRDSACSKPAGASRVSCTTRSYRCLGARTDRGIAVSCSRAGESIAFIAKRP
ncbi:MAG TPA: hypothetical protein VKG03_01840 [Solirubrobacterales bacterium]|nr:hypothetical protein [Solirubrobacterales bacterium]